MKTGKDFAAYESQRELEIDRKKIFRLQHKLRQKAHKLHEREELLQLREAALEEKESRTARLAEYLKKQQSHIVLQLKKNNEIFNLPKQNKIFLSKRKRKMFDLSTQRMTIRRRRKVMF
mmetsp:Transcript_25930/g.37171  ORF Transcript_25930/g.37171 Transcript_25930/m.37171 type:complete len:119 (-) Transcript_25930:279-635(-)